MENGTLQQTVNETDKQVQHIKGVIESLLFVNERPVSLDQIKKILDTVSASEIKMAITELQGEFEARASGIMVVEIAGGYQMLSNPLYASYLRNFYKTKHTEKLSKPALESMAIIAYRQPVTRADIEMIRGVNSDGVVNHLLDKELIKVIGRKDVPGRPYVYGSTKQFLEYFGLKSIDDLPELEEFPSLEPAAHNILPVEDGDEGQTDEQNSGSIESVVQEESQGTVDEDTAKEQALENGSK